MHLDLVIRVVTIDHVYWRLFYYGWALLRLHRSEFGPVLHLLGCASLLRPRLRVQLLAAFRLWTGLWLLLHRVVNYQIWSLHRSSLLRLVLLLVLIRGVLVVDHRSLRHLQQISLLLLSWLVELGKGDLLLTGVDNGSSVAIAKTNRSLLNKVVGGGRHFLTEIFLHNFS